MIKKPLQKKLGSFASVSLILIQTAIAQDSHWAGTPANTVWSDPNNWTPVGVPPAGDPVTTYQGNVWLDAANGDSVITIAASDVENPGVGNSTEVNNAIFGPEWGVTLNVFGTLNFDWLLFPVQNNPAAPRSYVNLYGTAVVSTPGAALGLGDSWFYTDAPYVTMNLYGNSQYKSLGGAGLWLGGHLNIYDTASFLVNGYINMDFNAHQTDATRAIVIGGGTLKLPEGYINGNNLAYNGSQGNIYDFINRGIVRAYGKGFDSNDLVVIDDGTNTIVTPVPLGGSLQQVYFQSLSRSSISAGTFEQATLVGDYPSVTGVLLSSSEPGLSPGSFAQPTYSSSNPNVVSVDNNGMIRAASPGTATLTAKVGALTSTNSLLITVIAAPTLIHEYSFNETSGTTAADSVAGNSPTWDASLIGGATLGGGQVTLDGASGFVELPAGILSGLDQVTIETWATFGSPINTWANLFAFGNTDPNGMGANYITMQPHTGGNTASANFGMGDPGNESDAVSGVALDGMVNVHIVAVYDPFAGSVTLYTNGVFAASNTTLYNNLVDPVSFGGPLYTNQSTLSYTLGSDPLNYIGYSLYSADPTLNGLINEFRIYNGVLSPARVMADFALGPDHLIGTSTTVSLTAAVSGGNLVLSWPITSALVNLQSSPTLGTSAAWTSLNATLSVVGSNYQVTIAPTASASFFRIAQ